MRNWRAAWYERHPEGLIGRLRELARTSPEAAHALIARLEREGWTGLMEDLQAPRAICPACDGVGVGYARPGMEDLAPDIRDQEECRRCGGEGLVPFPVQVEVEEGKGLLADFPPEEPLPF